MSVSALRFIVDESTGAAVVEHLRERGHDVVAVAESMPQARDSEILERAAEEERIVLTNDKDFGELAFRSGQTHHGIVLFRLRDESAQQRVRMLHILLDSYLDHLVNHFVVVTENGIRIRPA
jgi:predicted nuclease of predicted toxin-antitoxin system